MVVLQKVQKTVFLALSLASLVLATLVATSLIFPHAITHTAGVGLERLNSAASFTSCLVGIRKFARSTNAFFHTLHQCLALGVLNGPQRQQKAKNQTHNCNGTHGFIISQRRWIRLSAGRCGQLSED